VSAEEERVLIFAPTGRDGSLLQEALRRAGLYAEHCGDAQGFLKEVARPNGSIVLTEEALSKELAAAIGNIVDTQPPWSDLPILLLTSVTRSPAGRSAHLVKIAGPRGNVTLLERPIRMDTLVSVVNSALRSRRHQYEIRDHLIERAQDEEKYRAAAKLEGIGVLAGGIAHDFNNLLTGIIGNASLGLDMATDDWELRERLADVVHAGERAAELTSQLLAYAGKGRFVIRAIDLSALTADIAPLVKRFIPAHAELRLRLKDNLPAIEGDSGQLQQVVMNLIINAGEAIPEGKAGTVTVSTGLRTLGAEDCAQDFAASNPAPGEYVYLEVKDTGTGMPEEVKSRIFDPFFTTKFLGRGLGLAAVLGIVRSHKGALRVESEEGKGTVFMVFLPMAARVQTARVGPDVEAEEPLSATVLFADDEPYIRSVAAHALPHHGMHVHVATDGEEAIELYKRFGCDISLVILDMTMPGMGGEQCYQVLRGISATVPVILSSGFSEAMLHERFAGRGVAGFLKKPYTSKQLVEKIREVLASVNGQV
jgi:signal transduction histidine kinase/CheY-like chemotaxis protein